MLKKIIRNPISQEILAHIIALYMVLIRVTTRWEIIGEENLNRFANGEEGIICAYWHSRILMAHSIWPVRAKPYNMMISLSADGQFVARAAEIIGRKVIRGSSSKTRDDKVQQKGALKAFRAMVQAAKNGEASFITPDGPKGPRMRIQDGALRMAKSANVAILPIGVAIKKGKYLNSWDRFVVPPLFSNGVIIYGEPIFIENDDDTEKTRLLFENSLIEVTQSADFLMDCPLIEPQDAINNKELI